MSAVEESPTRPKEFIHHVTFRLNDAQATLAADLKATFASDTWGESHRWIYSDPVIVERMKADQG